MSSYFDYFCKNIESRSVGNNERIIGTCYSMCPEDEEKLREKEKLVHVLEVLGSQHKLVKCYSRSAADSNMAVPHNLRPYAVLTDTVQYLLLEVALRVDVSLPMLYDFLNDRLRAVRQDMTIQRLPPEECVILLEPMVRFYVYFGYLLSNRSLKEFDPVLNTKYLLESLKWYLNCCDSQGSVNELTSFLTNIKISKERSIKLKNDRVLMECMYILCNLDDVHPFLRYISMAKDLKREPKIQQAYKIAICNLQGNYIKVCRSLDQLSPIEYCALYCYLPRLQRRALRVMSSAYNKRLTVPSSAVAQWLRFDSQREAERACVHYGLKVEGATVTFDKTGFKTDAEQHKLTPQDLKKKFNIKNARDIFTYTTKKKEL